MFEPTTHPDPVRPSEATLRTSRLPADVVEVYSFRDAWIHLLSPDTSGVILHRDGEQFSKVAENLRSCTLREWGNTQAQRFSGSDETMLSAHISKELKRIGIPEEPRETLDLLTADMIRINKFVQCITGENDLRSHVGSMWRDARGFHIDTGDNIGAFVTYSGPGCLVVGRDDVVYDSTDPNQRKSPMRLALKPGVEPYITDTFDIVFLKGRGDLTNPSLENNVGLPHCSPNPHDPVRGFTQRLSYIVYGTAIGERFRAAPDFTRIPE